MANTTSGRVKAHHRSFPQQMTVVGATTMIPVVVLYCLHLLVAQARLHPEGHADRAGGAVVAITTVLLHGLPNMTTHGRCC